MSNTGYFDEEDQSADAAIAYHDPAQWTPGSLGSNTDMEVAARVALALCRFAQHLPIHVVHRPVEALRMCRADYVGRNGWLTRLAHVHGKLWAYDPMLGVWRVVPESLLTQMVSSFHGMVAVMLEDGKEKRKPYHVNNHVIKAVVDLIKTQLSHAEDFSWGSGAVYADVAVWCDGREIRQAPIGAGAWSENMLEVDMPMAMAQRDRRMRTHYAFRLPSTAGRWGSIGPGWHHAAMAGVWRSLMPVMMGHFDAMWGHRPDDLPQYVQTVGAWFGLGLLGRATAAQKALYLVGPLKGRNGKSTLMALLEAALPKEAVAHEDPVHWREDYQRGRLAEGQPFNLVLDTEVWDEKAASAVKLAVEGAVVTARAIGRDVFGYRPMAAWMIGSNRLQTGVGGLARRLLVLECDADLSGRHVPTDELVRRAAAEVPFLHAWGLSLAEQSLHALGGAIPMPSTSHAVEAESIRQATPFAEWASTYVQAQPGARMPIAGILERFRREFVSRERVSQQSAVRALQGLGFVGKNSGGRWTFEVRLV